MFILRIPSKFAVLSLLALTLLASGCSLIVDFEECTSNDECESGTCSDGVCLVTGGETCATHTDCTDQLCISERCRTVDSELCTVDTDLELSDARLLHTGILMPLSGRNGEKGAATVIGAEIAVNQINAAQGGIASRALSLISCDTQSDPARAVRAADHLINDLEINAVVGALLSDATLDVANQVSVDAGALLISPASTSPAISSLDDQDLVWRTIASDSLQGQALAELMIARDYQNVAVLFSSNAYGNGLFEIFTRTLNQAGETDRLDDSRFQTIQYDVAMGSLVSDSLVDRASNVFVTQGFQPDAIFVMGSIESQQIIFALDETYFGERMEEERPVWILTDGGRDPGLFGSNFDGIRNRIVGTSPQEIDTAVTAQFEVRFEADSEIEIENAPFADNAYDSMWLAALALGAQTDPIAANDPGLANAMSRMSSGAEFSPGDDASVALTTLRDGGSIDFQGASGDIDFDANGDVFNAIELWGISNTGDEFESREVLISSPGSN